MCRVQNRKMKSVNDTNKCATEEKGEEGGENAPRGAKRRGMAPQNSGDLLLPRYRHSFSPKNDFTLLKPDVPWPSKTRAKNEQEAKKG